MPSGVGTFTLLAVKKMREVLFLTAKNHLIVRMSQGIKTRLIMADFMVTIIQFLPENMVFYKTKNYRITC